MNPALFFRLAACLLLGVIVRAESNDVRFSQSLKSEERTASGLTRLTSDEVAVIDALVRRDTSARAGSTNTTTVAELFSQRLTAGERSAAGLPKLTPAELSQLNALIDRQQNARFARTLLAPPSYLSRSRTLTPSETKKEKEREIHGSFSLSYGMGSGGYSEKTGSMLLTFEDPARGLSISVGYSESYIKGGSYYRDPRYDLYRGSVLDNPIPPR